MNLYHIPCAILYYSIPTFNVLLYPIRPDLLKSISVELGLHKYNYCSF